MEFVVKLEDLIKYHAGLADSESSDHSEEAVSSNSLEWKDKLEEIKENEINEKEQRIEE